MNDASVGSRERAQSPPAPKTPRPGTGVSIWHSDGSQLLVPYGPSVLRHARVTDSICAAARLSRLARGLKSSKERRKE
jgi:hypothetical protein